MMQANAHNVSFRAKASLYGLSSGIARSFVCRDGHGGPAVPGHEVLEIIMNPDNTEHRHAQIVLLWCLLLLGTIASLTLWKAVQILFGSGS